MGAGIAQLGCAAGIPTVLHDPVTQALDGGIERATSGLERWRAKGRVGEEAMSLLTRAVELDGLAGCDLVIEAAPERPDLKRELFAGLSEVCGDDMVLATNTSSITVTSLAGAASRPENVVGMHFFNPPPLMGLLEVIRADQTGDRALAVAQATGEAMGKRVILAADGPGFLVNRCGRPFGAEALRLLQERVATPEQIDRICRLGGGFRMGPFELMDLVGVDVGYEVALSFTELSFGEPRWKPSPIQARMVAAGRLGRKSGHGYYEYADDGSYREPDLDAPAPGGGAGRSVLIVGDGAVAAELRELASAAGFDVSGKGEPDLVVDARRRATGVPDAGGVPLLLLCAGSSLALRGAPHAAGFHLLPGAALAELTRTSSTPDDVADAAEQFVTALGLHREWVGDAPGLVLGRIVCQLVNEALFAIGEGVGSEKDVDAGLTLGLNHPRGPTAWSETIGLDHVATVLDGLWAERREERYRPAPLLARRAPATSVRPRG